MSSERFFFKVGNFECTVVKDGEHAYPYPAKNVLARTLKTPVQSFNGWGVLFEHRRSYERTVA